MNLVWFKITDLRLKDHSALKSAFNKKKSETLLVFCLDPYFFQNMKFGHIKFNKHKQKFLYQSIINLYNNIKKNGGHLNIYLDSPENVIPQLVSKFHIKNIYHILDTTFEETNKLDKIIENCEDVTVNSYWDNTLYHLNDLPFDIKDMPYIFTNFRKQLSQVKFRDERTINMNKLKNTINDVDNISTIIEKNDNLKIDVLFEGGEDKAWERLNYYFYDKKLLSVYKKTRNGLLGKDYSSKFSPYLAFGNISAKAINNEIQKYEKEIEKNDSTYWLYFELLWRDFFRFSSLKYGNSIFKLGGIKNKILEWRSNNKETLELFEKWKNGQTGYPYIDANMIEMKKSGFMSNRGRQMVASFLVKDLKIDWRLGAEYFESLLIDYDVASNYGNWNYSAGIGADPREDRYFNVYKQGYTYDRNCKFILKWIPELNIYKNENIINVKSLTNYQKPIVFIKKYNKN